MLRPITVDKRSPFLGEECALCKQPFSPMEEVIVCPEDGSRHHTQCWRTNGNKCTAYGCQGHGEIAGPPPTLPPRPQPTPNVVVRQPAGRNGRSKVRVLPATSFGCAQNCLFLSIAIAILIIAVSCFGLWAIADYIMIEILGYGYRQPLSGTIFLVSLRHVLLFFS